MTDSTGAVAETLDYFPFGGIRLDTHPSTSSGQANPFTEQRKYIGQEFDADTGLNYLNARYYNSTIGRFTVQDPVALFTPEKLLQDPQQFNLYSYARNNPIVGSDPSGLIVVTVSGTNIWAKGSDYLKNNDTLQTNIKNDFKGQDIVNFKWSGGDNNNARQEAVKNLSFVINTTLNGGYPANEPVNIVCHSHGCNVAALYTQQSDAHQINNLISFGQPVLDSYSVNESKIDNHINVFSYGDKVQRIAGNQTSASAVLGYFIFGIPGYLVGSTIDWMEFGWAGRTVDGAQNKDVTQQNKGNWISAHGDLYQNQSIWDKFINKNIK